MNHRPFKSVLIANRGEIAARIVKEAKAAGLKAIAVYSDADKGARHVAEADAAVHIGPAPAAQSYLNTANILAAARTTKAEAIHPGYGFLSENADFAQAVIDAGLVWIGPSPSAIRAMGDKGNAKQLAIKANVPVIPGYDGDDQSDAKLLAEAKKIGWPVLIKAALGGGGRGQRRVTEESAFLDALTSARREALSAFASDRMILERALTSVRHIEVQVFGDAQGDVIHLGERNCSVQRRNQKVIEEAPAPGFSEALRARMGDAAVRLAEAVKYTNAGTVEFLLDGEGQYYFLEMNTRIQVEHPVTEEVTGLNLIAMQFAVAMGEPLAAKQGDVTIKGHAIEARLCAEDPADNFAPQSGHIEDLHVTRVARTDGVTADGNPASGHYDSMLAKVIAHGETRDEAREKLIAALEEAEVVGLRSNRNFLIDVLKRDAFINGAVDIGWLEREPAYTENNLEPPLGDIAALWLASENGTAWRSTGPSRAIVILRERTRPRRFVVENNRIGTLHIAEATHSTSNKTVHLKIEDEGRLDDAWVYRNETRVHVHYSGRDAIFEDITYAPAEPKGAGGANVVRAPMAGRIVKVLAEPGQQVAKNQLLVILEAMKMEHELRAAKDGVVETVTAKVGDQVAMRQTLVTLKIEEPKA